MMRYFVGIWSVGWEVFDHNAQNRRRLRFGVLGEVVLPISIQLRS